MVSGDKLDFLSPGLEICPRRKPALDKTWGQKGRFVTCPRLYYIYYYFFSICFFEKGTNRLFCPLTALVKGFRGDKLKKSRGQIGTFVPQPLWVRVSKGTNCTCAQKAVHKCYIFKKYRFGGFLSALFYGRMDP